MKNIEKYHQKEIEKKKADRLEKARNYIIEGSMIENYEKFKNYNMDILISIFNSYSEDGGESINDCLYVSVIRQAIESFEYYSEFRGLGLRGGGGGGGGGGGDYISIEMFLYKAEIFLELVFKYLIFDCEEEIYNITEDDIINNFSSDSSGKK